MTKPSAFRGRGWRQVTVFLMPDPSEGSGFFCGPDCSSLAKAGGAPRGWPCGERTFPVFFYAYW